MREITEAWGLGGILDKRKQCKPTDKRPNERLQVVCFWETRVLRHLVKGTKRKGQENA